MKELEVFEWICIDSRALQIMSEAERIARHTVPENGCLWVVQNDLTGSLRVVKAKFGEKPSPCKFSEYDTIIRVDAWDLRHGSEGLRKKAHRLTKRLIYTKDLIPRYQRILRNGN